MVLDGLSPQGRGTHLRIVSRCHTCGIGPTLHLPPLEVCHRVRREEAEPEQNFWTSYSQAQRTQACLSTSFTSGCAGSLLLHRLSSSCAEWGLLQPPCLGFSLRWLLLLGSKGSYYLTSQQFPAPGSPGTGSIMKTRMQHADLPCRGSDTSLHWQWDSLPLSRREAPRSMSNLSLNATLSAPSSRPTPSVSRFLREVLARTYQLLWQITPPPLLAEPALLAKPCAGPRTSL